MKMIKKRKIHKDSATQYSTVQHSTARYSIVQHTRTLAIISLDATDTPKPRTPLVLRQGIPERETRSVIISPIIGK